MLVCQAHTTIHIYIYMGVSVNGGTPHFTPQVLIILSRKTHGFVGESHHFRVHPHIYSSYNWFCLVLPGFESFCCGLKNLSPGQVVLVSLGSLTVEYRWDVPEHKWLDNGSTLRRPKVRGDESWGHQFWGPSYLQNPRLRWWFTPRCLAFFFIRKSWGDDSIWRAPNVWNGWGQTTSKSSRNPWNPLECWDIPTWMIWLKTDLVGGTLNFG